MAYNKEHTITAKVSKKSIWKLYENVETWSLWDPEVKHAALNTNTFSKGTKGTLHPKGGPKVKFELTEVLPEKSFTSTTFLPLAKMDFEHIIVENADGTLSITHRIKIEGFLSPFFAFVIGRKAVACFPTAIKSLIALANSKNNKE